MKYLGIDPGPEKTAWCQLNGDFINCGLANNVDAFKSIRDIAANNNESELTIAIEMVASYGMPVGAEVFNTCRLIGKLELHLELLRHVPLLIFRKDVKMCLCGKTAGINDAVIRQRLIDIYGAQGTKKNPGATYGIVKDMWAALAVAHTLKERMQKD